MLCRFQMRTVFFHRHQPDVWSWRMIIAFSRSFGSSSTSWTISSDDNDDELRSILAQPIICIQRLGCVYGFLSNYNETIFPRQLLDDQGIWRVEYSPVVHLQPNPTRPCWRCIDTFRCEDHKTQWTNISLNLAHHHLASSVSDTVEEWACTSVANWRWTHFRWDRLIINATSLWIFYHYDRLATDSPVVSVKQCFFHVGCEASNQGLNLYECYGNKHSLAKSSIF